MVALTHYSFVRDGSQNWASNPVSPPEWERFEEGQTEGNRGVCGVWRVCGPSDIS